MKPKKKLVFTSIAVLAFCLMISTVTAYAYSGSYSFDIKAAIHGDTKHDLSNLATSTTCSANSYDYNYNWSSTKYDYQVQIEKSFFTKYITPKLSADGTNHITNFGVISSGTYTVNVYKNTGSGTNRVVGSGTIDQ